MGKIFINKSYSINDFSEWDKRGVLILSPKFQRRRVWIEKAKSYLIDTIIRGLPLPPIFIREKIDLTTRKSVREVIDGQQRLAAILDYMKDGFTILKIHNEDFGNIYFSDLPADIQTEFLQYEIPTNVVSVTEDKDILGIFARLNTYTVPLNKTELMNAKFFGLFKQTIHNLAHEFHTFWITKKILSEQKISRMADVELTSDLVIASMDGIKDKKVIEKYYINYDDKFDNKKDIECNFKKCINVINNIYGEILPNSYFNGLPLFYSLYCLIYDLLYGMQNSDNTLRIQKSQYSRIRNALEQLEATLEDDDLINDQNIKQFIDDYKRHTTVEEVRKRRHRFLLNFITKYL
ncbi:MAG: DUF262 domain-containing protein [candidate division WOR-3 bacterium]